MSPNRFPKYRGVESLLYRWGEAVRLVIVVVSVVGLEQWIGDPLSMQGLTMPVFYSI